MQINNIITGDVFKNLADDFLDDEKPFIDLSKKPKVIFLKTDWLELFKRKILPVLNYKFILITHNGDRPCPSGHIDLLEDPRLIKWYGMNCEIIHPKLHSIPIGIANERWPHGNKKELIEVINETNIVKNNLCYCNFEVNTNFLKRSYILSILKNKNFIDFEDQKLPFKDYLTKLKSYKYVISPPGNSIDCHRIWEAIYLGVIPIIEKHLAMNYFYDLPILVVNSFDEFTIDLLESSYEEKLQKPQYKAYIQHYKNLINNECRNY